MTRKSTDDRKHNRTAVAGIVTVISLLCFYATAYFAAAVKLPPNAGIEGIRFRAYRTEIFAKSFIPAAWIEAHLTHTPVSICVDHSSFHLEQIYTAYP